MQAARVARMNAAWHDSLVAPVEAAGPQQRVPVVRAPDLRLWETSGTTGVFLAVR